MLQPVAMAKLIVLTLERFVDPLTVALGNAGVVHLVDAVDQSPNRLLEGVSRRGDIQALQSLASRCSYVAELLGIPLGIPGTGETDAHVSLEKAGTFLDDLLREFQAEDERINRLISESGTLAQRYDQLESFPFRKIRFGELRDLNFLYMETGRMTSRGILDVAQALGEKALVLREELPGVKEERVMILTSRKNRFAAEAELKKNMFKPASLGGDDEVNPDEELAHVKSKLAAVKQDVERHRSKVILLAEKSRSRLVKIHASVSRALALNQAKEKFGRAAGIFCVSGWIPAGREEEIRALVEKTTDDTAVIEVIKPPRHAEGEEPVPVHMPACAPLKPFQSLVAGFGAPRYGDIEPSLFVAISFVVMFGIMFGDIGQGLVLMLAGWYLLWSKRPSLKAIASHGYFFLFCGASATFFGFMFGSIFGYENENLLKPLWLNPLHKVMPLLISTIVIGIVFISLSMLINVYNRLRAKDYYGGLFANFGMLGALFYWGAIGLGVKAAVTREVAAWEIVVLIGLPLLLMFIREPLYNLLTKRKLLHEDPVSFVMTAGVEVLETVMSFLGNTVSFARVGAFALSHAALCYAIYVIVDALRDMGLPGGSLISLFVIIAGNLFVILLEGLVVTIQSIRLQYYELFSKYFPGDGVLYQPFSIGETPHHSNKIRTN